MYIYVVLGLFLILYSYFLKVMSVLTRFAVSSITQSRTWFHNNVPQRIPLPLLGIIRGRHPATAIKGYTSSGVKQAVCKTVPGKFGPDHDRSKEGGGHRRRAHRSHQSRSGVAPLTAEAIAKQLYAPGGVSTELEGMHITADNFEEHLPKILERLRGSIFVAFDLEFSGIGKPKDGTRAQGRGKMSLQDHYKSVKEKVEMYQVLQVGLCPVEWNEGEESYTAAPMNVYVSPIVNNRDLNVDRVFCLQASALGFLLDNGFDFNTQLRSGVQYLSKVEEEKIVETRIAEESGKRNLVPVDEASQQFAEDCIKALEDWENDPEAPWDFINITTDNNTINNYQRLLVHQIVRTKFPRLVSTSKNTFVCVTRPTEEFMVKKKLEQRESFEREINTAIGLRHVIDELFSPKRPDGGKYILVGHNLFVDLLHLYNTFIGKLPDRVEEFVEIMHSQFPVIIDTKFMATQGDNSATANSGSSLQLLWSLLRFQYNPQLGFHPDHTQYHDDVESYHEAGYDALLTAKILLKLAGRLAHETERKKGNDKEKEARSGAEEMPVNFLALGADDLAEFPDNILRIPRLRGQEGMEGEAERFWGPYMNRLRLFGTEEGELKLG